MNIGCQLYFAHWSVSTAIPMVCVSLTLTALFSAALSDNSMFCWTQNRPILLLSVLEGSGDACVLIQESCDESDRNEPGFLLPYLFWFPLQNFQLRIIFLFHLISFMSQIFLKIRGSDTKGHSSLATLSGSISCEAIRWLVFCFRSVCSLDFFLADLFIISRDYNYLQAAKTLLP